MTLIAIFGSLAAIASTVSFTPQAWKIIKSRDTAAISAPMYVITVVGFALWTGYGLLLGQWPIIVTNSICLLLSGFILAMKLLPPRERDKVAAALDPEK
jgi:MtN3 and saliva related transmembrane protein